MLKRFIIIAFISIPPIFANELNLSPGRSLSTDTFPRYGLNLGGPSYWGAEQLRANIVRNPGFMPLLDRSIVIVDSVAGRQVSDKDAWVARADGFWTGASYTVLTGAMAGKTGRVLDYRKKTQGSFWLDQDLAALQIGDAISVSKTAKTNRIDQWWSSGRSSLLAQGDGFVARLQASPNQAAQISSFFDTLGGEAGRLLPISGEWQLRLRVRSERAGAKLLLRFARDQQTPFVQESITPTSEWQNIELNWKGVEAATAKAAPLSLNITAEGDGEIWLDDVYLGEKNPLPGGFRRAVVDTLKTIQPGYLRDWQGQLGDELANRFASESQRHPIRYRPGENESFYAYSVPDLFALCAQTQAKPWLIGPPTFSSSEWFNFGQRIAQLATQYQIDEVLLEFGNENWNALFRPAGLSDVTQHQLAAERAFAAAKQGFASGQPKAKLVTLVNAPFLWGDSPGAIVQTKGADRVAVAPYFLYQINADENLSSLRQRALASQSSLFNKQQQLSQAKLKRLAIYEINFHSTLGSANAQLRSSILNSPLAGVALARQLLDASLAGVREQAVYSLAGYSFKLDKGLGDIPLFGITRDLSQANRLRPTGRAQALLNEVAAGQVNAVNCAGDERSCQQLSAVQFRRNQQLSYAFVNASEQSHLLNLPCDKTLKWALLDGSVNTTQEILDDSMLKHGKASCKQGAMQIKINPQSLLTLQPER